MWRLPALLLLVTTAFGQSSPAELLIEAGHWKRARALVEKRILEAPDDPLANFLSSQIRAAFGGRSSSPLQLAERAVALDARTAKYHRQIAEVVGIMAQHANPVRQLFYARRFRSEIETALKIDPNDRQALRDLVEFYLLAPGVAGGDGKKAAETADRLCRIDAAEGLLARARVAASRKDEASEVAALQQAAAVQPASYRAQIALAQFHLDRHNWSAAESAANRAVQLDPDRSAGYAALAAAYAGEERWNDLDALLLAATNKVPDDLIPYFRAAELIADSHPDRAERYLRKYLSQEPEGNQPSLHDADRLLQRCSKRHNSR